MRFSLLPLKILALAVLLVWNVGPAMGQRYAFQRQYENPEPQPPAFLGGSLAFLGPTTLVVGAPDVSSASTFAGKVFILDLPTGTTLHTLELAAPFARARFGESVSVVGDKVVVGAPGDLAAGGQHPGFVLVYDGGTGALLRTIENPTPAAHDSFGLAVLGVGNTVLVGAPGDDTANEDSGAAYVFDVDTGALLLTILNPSGEEDEYFGGSIAALGSDFLIGRSGYGANGTLAALGNDVVVGSSNGLAVPTSLFDGTTGALLRTFTTPETPTPAVYVFDPTTGAILHTLLPPPFGDIYADIQFGRSVTTIGSHIVVGSFGHFFGGLYGAGAVFMFDGATGALEQTITKYTPGDADGFGWVVLASGTQLAISNPGGPKLASAGSVLVYDACGDGLLATAEQCDDGNLVDGDGCSAACHLELCPPAPRPGCRQPVAPGKSKLHMRRQRNDPKNQYLDDGNAIRWSWSHGAATSLSDLADPRSGRGYALCLYDASGASQPLLDLAARSGDSWRAAGSAGFRYGSKTGFPDGIASLHVRGGPDGTPKITLGGKGGVFRLPPLPLAPPVTMQLVNGDTGVCWGATFSQLDVNDAITVKARSN